MQVFDFEDGYLLSADWHQNNAYARFEVLDTEGRKCRVDATSLNGTDVQVVFHPMSLRAGTSTVDGTPCLGGIDGASISSTRMVLEGDFGCLTVTAGRIEIDTI